MKGFLCKKILNMLHGRGRRAGLGYTLAEVLIAVTLVGVVGAAAAVGGTRMVSSFRQSTLDELAQTLYTAAQAQLTERYAYGGMSALSPSAEGVGVVEEEPYGYPGLYAGPEDRLCYIRNKPDGVQSASNPAAAALFPADALSSDMAGMNWVVEYDASTGTVFAVFYSESFAGRGYTEFYGTEDTDALRRSASARGGRVGYYAGGVTKLPAREIGDMSCAVEIENGDQLLAHMTCVVPEQAASAVTLTFDIEVTGRESGHTVSRTVTPALSLDNDRTYEYTLVLDSLDGEGAFCQSFARPDAANGVDETNALIPGENITVYLTVSGQTATSGLVLPEVGDHVTTNSLFAYDPDADRDLAVDGARLPALYDDENAYIARIACARHLQNLDAAVSGFAVSTAGTHMPTDEVRAVQLADVDFSADSEGRWAAVYPGMTFTPVVNPSVVSYDGQGHVIRGLKVNYVNCPYGADETDAEKTARQENAGLFGVFSGSVLRGVTLVDAQIGGGANAGTLAGTLAGQAVSVYDCGAYLETLLSGADEGLVTGSASAGGLVGRAAGKTLISGSYAATVVRGGVRAGGLVGASDGVLTVTGSYADCYIGAETVGGLAGSCARGSSFDRCYSAGFVLGAPAAAAGLAPDAAVISNVYSLFNFDDVTSSAFGGGALTFREDGSVERYPSVPASATARVKIALVGTGGSGTGWYTYHDADARGVSGAEYMSAADMVAKLNGIEWKSEDDTHPYALAACLADTRKDGRIPAFLGLAHYGDWLEGAPDRDLYARIYKNGSDYALVFEYGPAEDSAVYGTAVEGAQWKGKDTFLKDVYTSYENVPWAVFQDQGVSKSRVTIGTVAFNIADDEAKVRPAATAYWFHNFIGMTAIGDVDASGAVTQRLTKLATDSAVSLDFMFYNCSRLTTLDVSGFDTGRAASMRSMFYNCSALTALDVSGFDTHNVTAMDFLFCRCTGVTALDVSGFDTANVETMESMFAYCPVTELALSGFDTGKCVAMNRMFMGCSRLQTLDLSSFDTSSVVNMQGMFQNCSALLSVDVSSFDTSRVTDMNSMFYYCRSLASIDASGFDTSRVTDMMRMFSNCLRAASIDVSGFDTAAVTGMEQMFASVRSVDTLDLGSFDTANVTNMSNMFNNCTTLRTIYVSDAFVTSQVTDSAGMFGGCRALLGGEGTAFDAEHVDAEYACIDGGTEAPGYFAAVPPLMAAVFPDGEDHVLVFARGDELSDYGTPVAGPWDGGADDGFLTAAYDAAALPPWLESAAADGYAISRVAFARPTAPASTAFWFADCAALTTIDGLAYLDTSSVTDMSSMFAGCAALTALDLTSFDTALTSDMSRMFDGCEQLTAITVSDAFTTDAVTASEDMFAGCAALIGGAGTAFDAGHTDAEYARVDGGADAPGYFTAVERPEDEELPTDGQTEAEAMDGVPADEAAGDATVYDMLTNFVILRGSEQIEVGGPAEDDAQQTPAEDERPADNEQPAGEEDTSSETEDEEMPASAAAPQQSADESAESDAEDAQTDADETRDGAASDEPDADVSAGEEESAEAADVPLVNPISRWLAAVWYDGRHFYTTPTGEEGSLVTNLKQLTLGMLPAKGETYRLTFGRSNVLIYSQWKSDGYGNETFWRLVLTGEDGTLILTAGGDGGIFYNDDADIRYDAQTRRFYSDKKHTILLTNISALIGPRESRDGTLLWPRAGAMTPFYTDTHFDAFSVIAHGDSRGVVDHYTGMRWDGTVIFRADAAGTITYLYDPAAEAASAPAAETPPAESGNEPTAELVEDAGGSSGTPVPEDTPEPEATPEPEETPSVEQGGEQQTPPPDAPAAEENDGGA